MVLTESAKFAENVLAPLNEVGDTVGDRLLCLFNNNKIQ